MKKETITIPKEDYDFYIKFLRASHAMCMENCRLQLKIEKIQTRIKLLNSKWCRFPLMSPWGCNFLKKEIIEAIDEIDVSLETYYKNYLS